MGATLSVFSPTNSHLKHPVKRASYALPFQPLSTTGTGHRKLTEGSQSARTMIAQHFNLMNAITLKKLISSGTINRSKKNAKSKLLAEENLVKQQQHEAVEKVPRAGMVVKEDCENVAPGQEFSVAAVVKDEEAITVAPPNVIKRTVLQASTSELLRCFGEFLHGRFRNLSGEFSPHDPMLWLRGLDRNLIAQGWQDIGFINPANIVFLYLLLRDLRMESVKSLRQLQAQVLTALYLSYSYMGHEISYPVKLFLYADDNKDEFWKRCLRLIDVHSGEMLRLNSDSGFFAKIFAELKSFGAAKPVQYIF